MPVSYKVILVGETEERTRFMMKYILTQIVHPLKQSVWCLHRTNRRLLTIATPPDKEFRREEDYSWKGMFRNAVVIVKFGYGSFDEIGGTPPKDLPEVIEWSGNDTMKRILDKIQEICSPSPGFS
jgi:hypothetical protein